MKTADDTPILAYPILPTKKFPIGAFTDTNDEIGPTVVIDPGVATGVNGVGKPNDNPPREDVNPYGPAKTPIFAFTLDSAVSVSQVIEP